MQTLKPSKVMRLVKAKKMPHNLKGGRIRCAKCGGLNKGQTESPMFWENGMYVYCTNCREETLAKPEFPACEGFPEGFAIDLGGERKKYPLILS